MISAIPFTSARIEHTLWPRCLARHPGCCDRFVSLLALRRGLGQQRRPEPGSHASLTQARSLVF